MCIIVYKPAGIKSPSWTTLHNCFENNNDGAGFMYAENDKVYFEKGFMSWKSFKRAFKPFKNRTDLPIVVHFRITTHGGTSRELCHPFPLSSDRHELRKTSGITDVGIAHNGCIPLTSNADKGMSDTSEFIQKYANIVITGSEWYNNPKANIVLSELISSKMLVLSKDGHGEIVGDGWKEEDGVLFSNSTYQKQSWVYYSSYYANDWYDDDWESGYWHEYTDKSISSDSKKKKNSNHVYSDYPTYCEFWFNEDGKSERIRPAKECDGCIEKAWCWGC